MSPALSGRFLTTAPPGKPSNGNLFLKITLTTRVGEEDKVVDEVGLTRGW